MSPNVRSIAYCFKEHFETFQIYLVTPSPHQFWPKWSNIKIFVNVGHMTYVKLIMDIKLVWKSNTKHYLVTSVKYLLVNASFTDIMACMLKTAYPYPFDKTLPCCLKSLCLFIHISFLKWNKNKTKYLCEDKKNLNNQWYNILNLLHEVTLNFELLYF